MNKRIVEVRKNLKITQVQVARDLGLKQSSICDIEHGRCKVTERFIIAFCARYHVNENWFRTGQGNMFIEHDEKFEEFFKIYQTLTPALQDFLISIANELLKTHEKL